MKNMLQSFVVALGVVAASGCQPEANKAADRVIDRERALDKEIRDPAAGLESLDKRQRELDRATAELIHSRAIRAATLRAQHAVIATQPALINTMVETFPLTEKGRTMVGEKLVILRMRLDETAHLIERLAKAEAVELEVRNDAVTDAMNRLEDARKDAWKALGDAPRTDRSS
jgi:hypothetical protein